MIALLVVTAMGCGMRNLCRRQRLVDDEVSSPSYNVAVSNSIFREDSGSGREQMRCMNCILIEMGEMACYTERCPDCGRIPPGRKKQKPPDLLRKLVGRKLSVKKPPKPSQTAVMVMEAGMKTNTMTLRNLHLGEEQQRYEDYSYRQPLPDFVENPVLNGGSRQYNGGSRKYLDDSIV